MKPLHVSDGSSVHHQEFTVHTTVAYVIKFCRQNCPKHVEFYSKYKFEKLVHLVGFITQKRIVSHTLKKCPLYFWTWRFITVCTIAAAEVFLWTKLMHSTPQNTASIRYSLILSCHLHPCLLRFPSHLCPSKFWSLMCVLHSLTPFSFIWLS